MFNNLFDNQKIYIKTHKIYEKIFKDEIYINRIRFLAI
jgi:hypothetical protein